jgi:hypothetical protein
MYRILVSTVENVELTGFPARIDTVCQNYNQREENSERNKIFYKGLNRKDEAEGEKQF